MLDFGGNIRKWRS
jgi:hypothetical protein